LKFKFPKLSIFLKLVITVLTFGLLLNICVLIIFRMSTEKKPRQYLMEFSRKMEKSLVYDIGVPPDTVKAKQICDDLEIGMRFESDNMQWSTSEDIPPLGAILEDRGDRVRFEEDESIIAHHRGKPYSLIRYPQGVFIIKPFNPEGFYKPERAITLLILFISVVLILLYFLLRALFKPLKELSGAVRQIGDGNYNVKLPVKRNDELGELAMSLNEMSEKIRTSLKAKEQLLIDVSHELRSPLTRIKLGLEIDSSKEKIEEDVLEMEKMVTGLLENYRSDSDFNSVRPERTDVIELLEETISEYDQPERIVFTKPGNNKDIYSLVDMDKMQIVFRNLIENAMKYSEEKIELSITEKSGYILISFKDRGIGIPAENIKYIFEPFYRADPSRSRQTGGFGLGLSICKKIIEAHKGEIVIHSKAGEGTEVILKLKSVK